MSLEEQLGCLCFAAGMLALVSSGCDEEFSISGHLVEPEEGVAEDIEVDLWCTYWSCDWNLGPGDGLEMKVATVELPTEGDLELNHGHYGYYLVARASGYYSRYYTGVQEGETVFVDLDRVPPLENVMAGTIASQCGTTGTFPSGETAVHAIGPGEVEFDFVTDAQGRYGFSDMPAGRYLFRIEAAELPSETLLVEVEVQHDGGFGYLDIVFENPLQNA